MTDASSFGMATRGSWTLGAFEESTSAFNRSPRVAILQLTTHQGIFIEPKSKQTSPAGSRCSESPPKAVGVVLDTSSERRGR